MGRTAIIIVFVLLVIAGSIFINLTQKQTKAIDSIIQENYSKQARHLANTYAHSMVGKIRRAIDENGELNNLDILIPLTGNDNYTIILDIPQASISATINETFKDNYSIGEGEYGITSIGRVKSPEGRIYEAITYLIYTTGDSTSETGMSIGQYVALYDDYIRTTTGPGNSQNFNINAYNGALNNTSEDITYSDNTQVFIADNHLALGAGEALNNLAYPLYFKATNDLYIAGDLNSNNSNNVINLFAGKKIELHHNIINKGIMNIYTKGDFIIDSKAKIINNGGTLNIYVEGSLNLISQNKKHFGEIVNNGGIINIYAKNNVNHNHIDNNTNFVENISFEDLPNQLSELNRLFSSQKGNPRIKVWEEQPIKIF